MIHEVNYSNHNGFPKMLKFQIDGHNQKIDMAAHSSKEFHQSNNLWALEEMKRKLKRHQKKKNDLKY